MTIKAQSTKETLDKFDCVKMNNFSSLKDTVKEGKDKPQIGRKYLQSINWTKNPI